MSKPCILCHKQPCLCAAHAARDLIVGTVSTSVDKKAAVEAIGIGKPSVDDTITMLSHPDSPYCLTVDETITVCNALRAAAMAVAARAGSTLEDVKQGLFVDLSQAAARVVEAIDLIVKTSAVLDETHPKISAHRAWLVDQLLDILADRHYDCFVLLSKQHFVGESPFPETGDEDDEEDDNPTPSNDDAS